MLVRYRLRCAVHTTKKNKKKLGAHIELFSEELAIVCGAYPVLLLQRVQRDGEVPLGWRGRSGEEDHCLLSCVLKEYMAVRLLTFPNREHYKLS